MAEPWGAIVDDGFGPTPSTHQFPVDGNAAQLGPILGYKLALDRGFTIEIQIGYQKTWIWQRAGGDPAGLVTRIDDSGLLLNLNTGWSFLRGL